MALGRTAILLEVQRLKDKAALPDGMEVVVLDRFMRSVCGCDPQILVEVCDTLGVVPPVRGMYCSLLKAVRDGLAARRREASNDL